MSVYIEYSTMENVEVVGYTEDCAVIIDSTGQVQYISKVYMHNGFIELKPPVKGSNWVGQYRDRYVVDSYDGKYVHYYRKKDEPKHQLLSSFLWYYRPA